MRVRAGLMTLTAIATLAAFSARPAAAGFTVELAVGRGYLYTQCAAGMDDGSSSLEMNSLGGEGCVARLAPGYEWSWGRARFGVELAVAHTRMSADVGGDALAVGACARARTGRVATASGRIGIEIAPGTQIYARVGYSTMEYHSEIITVRHENSDRNRGEVQALTAGGGFQVEFAHGWAVRFEYAHMDFEPNEATETLNDIEGVEAEQLRWMLEPRIDAVTIGIVRLL
jgi:opacity protein-like surface antigen